MPKRIFRKVRTDLIDESCTENRPRTHSDISIQMERKKLKYLKIRGDACSRVMRRNARPLRFENHEVHNMLHCESQLDSQVLNWISIIISAIIGLTIRTYDWKLYTPTLDSRESEWLRERREHRPILLYSTACRVNHVPNSSPMQQISKSVECSQQPTHPSEIDWFSSRNFILYLEYLTMGMARNSNRHIM